MKCPIEMAQEMSAWRALEKERVVTSSRKNDGATGCGKAAWWKSQKADFPTTLGNPANPAGFPLSHSPDDYGRLTKIEHSLFCEKGTLLKS
jgi:hypothetical protein